MMKKMLTLLLAAAMLATMAGLALAESAPAAKGPKLLSLFNLSVDDWYVDETSRVMFATCAWMDVILDQTLDKSCAADIGEAVRGGSVYVAKDGSRLIVMCFSKKTTILVSYTPENGAWKVSTLSPFEHPDKTMAGLQKEGSMESYFQVSGEEMVQAYQYILALITQ